jgi:hypothetical protein
MNIKNIILAATSVLGLALWSTVSHAANPVDPAACTVSGLVQAGGGLSGEGYGTNVSGIKSPATWAMAFGEAALDYACNDWVGQLDGAYYGHWASENTPVIDISNSNGHVGGAAFWRNADVGELGIAASRIFQTNSVKQLGVPVVTDVSGGLWRIGGFGEYYGGEMFTLGAGANYINGQAVFYQNPATPLDHTGFEADIYAKFYPSDNFGLTMRGDVLSSTMNALGQSFNWKGYAVSAEAEYLIPDSAFSLFASARYAKRTLDNNAGSYYSFDDKQGLLGIRFAFGGSPVSSLRDRDRHGSYDNTSVFDEKLPSFDSEYVNSQAAP